MREARATVLAACKKNKLAFLSTVRANDVKQMIDAGAMTGSGGVPETAEKGHRYSKRQVPW